MSKENFRGFLFEMIGMAFFAYGIVSSQGKSDYITAAFFGALVICAPISGGHINPAVTLGMLLSRNIGFFQAISYWIAQILGAFIGACISYLILGGTICPIGNDNFFLDAMGEILGTGFFVLFILLQCGTKTTFTPDGKPISTLLFISTALHFSRQLTVKSGGCINPGMAIAFNIFNILLKGNIFKLETLFVYILAPFGGSAGAVFLFFIYQYLVEKKNAK